MVSLLTTMRLMMRMYLFLSGGEVRVPPKALGAGLTGMLANFTHTLPRLQPLPKRGDASAASRSRPTPMDRRSTRARRNSIRSPLLSARCGWTCHSKPRRIKLLQTRDLFRALNVSTCAGPMTSHDASVCCYSRWRRQWSPGRSCSCPCCRIRRSSWPGQSSRSSPRSGEAFWQVWRSCAGAPFGEGFSG